ncbi:MAG: hypothetical protein V3R95_06300 [Dehalococcoidia bacterium]
MPAALRHLGYSREQVDEIVQYCAGSGRLEGAPHINRITLSQRGFTQPALDAVDAALATAFHVSFAFNRYVLGDGFCRDALGLTDEQLDDPAFDLLASLGFDREQIDEANDHVLGRMTIEDAPHLKEEHYPVFDCATKCGKYGQRYIAPLAHVRIMLAAQPFLSGAISKTINMPNEATIDEVRGVYDAAATGMVKALALYRDGSKLSQPLAAAIDDDLSDEQADLLDEGIEQAAAAAGGGDHPAVAEAERIIRALPVAEQTQLLRLFGAGETGDDRRRLPARRNGYGQKARVGGHAIYLHTGEFEDGQLGEIFVSMAKDGAAFRSLMNCFAIAVSIGLQHGVPLNAFVDSFVFTKFEPNGIVTGHDRIQMATSIIDYVFRELAVSYLGRDDLAHVGPVDLNDGETAEKASDAYSMSPGVEEPAAEAAGDPPALPDPIAAKDVVEVPSNGAAPASQPAPEPLPVMATAPARGAAAAAAPSSGSPATASINSAEMARQRGFEGAPSDECGQMMMVRNGTCLKCVNCGATSGCS